MEDLRTLSLSETGALRLHREPTDLAELLAESVAAFRAKADAASVALSSSVDDHLPVLELTSLRQVIGNLLDNAVRLTPAGGSVKVRCATAGDGVLIEVQDTGPGIADVLPRIFDRFYRSGERGGSGWACPSRGRWSRPTGAPSRPRRCSARARPSASVCRRGSIPRRTLDTIDSFDVK